MVRLTLTLDSLSMRFSFLGKELFVRNFFFWLEMNLTGNMIFLISID